MQYIALDYIEVGERQRKTISSKDINIMIESLTSTPAGLLHPIVVVPHPVRSGIFRLVAGETRLRAITQMHEAGTPLYHSNAQVVKNFIPATILGEDLTIAQLFEAEYVENAHRADLSWQDNAAALATLYKYRQAEDSATTKTSVATEISEKLGEHGPAVKTIRHKLQQAIVVEEHLDDPDIAKARNMTEAYNLAMRREYDALNAERLKREYAIQQKIEEENKKKEEEAPTPITIEETSEDKEPLSHVNIKNFDIYQGSCHDILPTLPPNTIDLILADPPYGVDAQKFFRNKTAEHHNYRDSADVAKHIIETIAREGFKLTKPKANAFLFLDISLWDYTKEVFQKQGWTVWRTPIIWQKSKYEGVSPWQRSGFIRTYELIFWATKGQLGIHTPRLDILTYNRVKRNEREHGAEKPVDLLQELISISTSPGDIILDPCCGVGSSLVAARTLGRTGIGVELKEAYFNVALARVNNQPLDPSLFSFVEEDEGEGDPSND